MKVHLRIFPIFLSLTIFLFAILKCNIIAQASYGGGGASSVPGERHDTAALNKFIGDTSWEDMPISEKWAFTLNFTLAQLKAITSGDASSYIQGKESFNEFINKDPLDVITVTEDGIILPEDLVAAIKQALTEYVEESCGFWIMPTVDFRLLSGANFNSNYVYQSLKNIVNEKEIVIFGARGNGVANYLLIPDIYSDDIPMVYICTSSSYDPSTLSNSVGCPTAFYGADTWTKCTFRNYYINPSSVYTTYEEFKEEAGLPTSTSEFNISSFYTNLTAPFSGLFVTSSRYMLISKDGRHVKVYKSLDAYKYACTSTRPVYFGSGFYENVGEVKVSFDELQDYLDGKYDSFFDDLQAILPDNSASLSEEELEKLVDQILDKLGDVGDDIGGGIDKVDGSLKETNSILGSIASALSGYFESVLAYLDGILVSIQGLIYVETIKPDDEHLDLSDMINDVWKDPQNGSQAVADSLSASFSDIGSALMAKFPFCIPNDLYSLMCVFSHTPESRAAPMSLDDDEIQLYSGAGTAPYFELPFVIESFGIEEVVIIDMAVLQPLSTTARVFFSLIFVVALMKLSAMVIQLINNAWGGIS